MYVFSRYLLGLLFFAGELFLEHGVEMVGETVRRHRGHEAVPVRLADVDEHVGVTRVTRTAL